MGKNQTNRISEYYRTRHEYKIKLGESLTPLKWEEVTLKRGNLFVSVEPWYWEMNLEAWQDTIMSCLSEIHYSVIEALASFKMYEDFSKQMELWLFRYFHDNAVYRLFACEDKVIHLLLTFYKLDIDEKTGANFEPKKLKKIYYDFRDKENRAKFIRIINEKSQNSCFLEFVDSINKVLEFYREYRNSKTHRKEPSMLLDKEVVFPGSLWVNTEKPSNGEIITHFGTGSIFTPEKLRDEVIRTYEEMISVLKDLFLKLREEINHNPITVIFPNFLFDEFQVALLQIIFKIFYNFFFF
jgi:hypothetical protein